MFLKFTRWFTIASGFSAAVIMTAELFVDDPSSFREVTIFNFILVWSVAWFFANAVRFFDAHNELWLRLSGLLALGLPLMFFGVFTLADVEFPISRSNASEASLGASALIVGIAALFSATRVPVHEEPSNWSFDLISSIKQDPLRWLTITSGLMLAVFIAISPTFVPAAVAVTCAVRYADTMPPANFMRRVALMAMAFVLGAGIIVLWSNSFQFATLPTAFLVAACILAIFRRNQTPESTDASSSNRSVG